MPQAPRIHTSRGQLAARQARRWASRTPAAGNSWYQTPIWKQLRREHLGEHPCCVKCLSEGAPPAQARGNVVDHIQPHAGNWDKFADPANLQTLCKKHHSSKTAREDGGFGNRKRRK